MTDNRFCPKCNSNDIAWDETMAGIIARTCNACGHYWAHHKDGTPARSPLAPVVRRCCEIAKPMTYQQMLRQS